MQRLWILALLFPLAAFGQYDFENRYLRIEANTLPQVEAISNISLYNGPTLTYTTKLKTFQMNARNYRQEVDMMAAVTEQNRFIRQDYDLSFLQDQFYGSGAEGYQSDGANSVKNTVYQEMRGLDLVNSCPPTGICARCAPYRLGRGF